MCIAHTFSKLSELITLLCLIHAITYVIYASLYIVQIEKQAHVFWTLYPYV